MDEGICHMCKGAKLVAVGLIVLANFYWEFADWWLLAGVLLVLFGLLKMVKPTCPHCKAPAKAAVAVKPRKK